MKTLPHQSEIPFISDGGQETTLVFLENIELPCFAAFHYLVQPGGRGWFRRYYEDYIDLARRFGAGFVLESPTWRANPDWGRQLGYAAPELREVNRRSIELLLELRDEQADVPMVVSGCIGPRGDGYAADRCMSAEVAEEYHSAQAAAFREFGADVVTAMTMTHAGEAAGVARAAAAVGLPSVISFTTETDGRLPDGMPLDEAIGQLDALGSAAPAYFMINCMHPTHVEPAVTSQGTWRERIVGLRANASCRSHAELDEATELDIGNPVELAQHYQDFRRIFPNLNVFGGCCGTDVRHLGEICACCFGGATAAKPVLRAA
ncbi:MAG: homocysteine S-methyltransferase family protein [Terrimicrobiaceae bacterium]|nr:homocysteine S-methyltransferase family protein [Terrimicrobiaceae bacterium]